MGGGRRGGGAHKRAGLAVRRRQSSVVEESGEVRERWPGRGFDVPMRRAMVEWALWLAQRA